MERQIITVFGATGNQGGSVVEALLQDSEYSIRAVTRDNKGKICNEFRRQGVHVVKANLNDKSTLYAPIEGATGVFLVTRPNYNDYKNNYFYELEQFRNVGEVCQDCGVQKIIVSTFTKEVKIDTLYIPEMVCKYDGYQYMKTDLGLPVAGIMMCYYYENIINGDVKLMQTAKNTYGFGLPLGSAQWPIVSVKDVGEIVHQMYNKFDKYNGEIVPIIKEKLTLAETAATLTKHMSPVKFVDLKKTDEQYLERLDSNPNLDEYIKFFQLTRNHQYGFELDRGVKPLCQQLNPKMISFDKWVSDNKEKLKEIYKERDFEA